MSKILLVEDDVNLREVYATRLSAEGYDVVTASDGEEALASAVKERPDLILLDVMMPKISGFDVLDILRSTPETKDAKIVMMTALSQQSDRERGEQLGVNKYLVKSQITLEDVVNTVKEMLGDASATPAAPTAPAATAPASPAPTTSPPAAGAVPPAMPTPATDAITPQPATDASQPDTPAPAAPISIPVQTPPPAAPNPPSQTPPPPPPDKPVQPAQQEPSAAPSQQQPDTAAIPLPSAPPPEPIEPAIPSNEAINKENPNPGEVVSPSSDNNVPSPDQAL